MAVSAIFQIEQISGHSGAGHVLDSVIGLSSKASVQESLFSVTSSLIFSHLDQVSNPVARPSVTGWGTEFKTDWSDSPVKQPLLEYHRRFGFGRDNRERYTTGQGGGTVIPPNDGHRWGNLDDNSGVLIYERDFPISSSVSLNMFRLQNEGDIQERDIRLSSSMSVSHLPTVKGDTILEMFPFLITALPEPFSHRNPTDTDVSIRLSNFTFPIASGTINLFLNGIPRAPLHITPFTGGLGGYDVLWHNDQDFDYDSIVSVRWEFFDTDVPANKVFVRYRFYTVPDLAPPRILNLVPKHGATGVLISGPIRFDLEDFEGNVDISTLRMFVNNVRVVDGVTGSLTIFETAPGRYTIDFSPNENWLYGDLIPVSVFVKDDSVHKNELFFSYSFTTEESQAPRILNPIPEPCEVQVPTNTNIQVDVVDGGGGLDDDSIVITVEDTERGNDITLIPIVHRDE